MATGNSTAGRRRSPALRPRLIGRASRRTAAALALGVLGGTTAHATSDRSDEQRLRALAERCGSGIEWLRDLPPTDEAGGAFQYVRNGRKLDAGALTVSELPPAELEGRIEMALERARREQRLVLWHVTRLEGGHMYRAPVLDDYMDQVFWSDPALVETVRRDFVPLRTRVSKKVGEKHGIVAWEMVEPALVFLAPDGKVVHRIDRIRTFDARWLLEVLRRVLAAHPELDPPDVAASAREAFATLDATQLESTRADYYAALDAWLRGADEDALARWHELTTAAPESPYAWRAAANLVLAPDQTRSGAAAHAFEWPYESWLPPGGALPTDTRWRRPAAEAGSVAENAVRWLLRMQRADGSWSDCRYAYWDTPAITPNAWMAISALCASALLEWRDLAPDEIDAALIRAERYLFHDGLVNAGRNEEMYAHAYRIDYLLRTLAGTEDEAQRAGLLERVQQLVDRLGAMQDTGGQWAHEYPNAFCSAVVLDAMAKARDAGARPDPAVVERGLAGLAAARFDDGSFVYGGRLGSGAKAARDAQKDSCGRMPVCEGALFAWKKSDLKSVVRALAVYQQFFDRFEKVSKTDFHTDGELGGFFFFHDLFHASETVMRLPAAGQKSFQAFLVERIAALPEIDGSFLDDHEIGKSCSTAYALLALANALREPQRG